MTSSWNIASVSFIFTTIISNSSSSSSSITKITTSSIIIIIFGLNIFFYFTIREQPDGYINFYCCSLSSVAVES